MHRSTNHSIIMTVFRPTNRKKSHRSTINLTISTPMHAWSQSQIANSNSSFGGEGLIKNTTKNSPISNQIVYIKDTRHVNVRLTWKMVAWPGSARWAKRLSMGPVPVYSAWNQAPMTASMARRPFLISLVRSSLIFSGEPLPQPSGSNHRPPGYLDYISNTRGGIIVSLSH